MYQFDEYINSIIGDLKISKKKKYEMTEEFKDHLQMLKSEYISKGSSESEAVKKAIESFGQENNLKRIFADEIVTYRNYINVFVGIILFLLIFRIGAHIPLPGLNTGEGINIFSLSIVMISLFIPLGYFMPVVFRKVKNISHVITITLPLAILHGIWYSIISTNSVLIEYVFLCTIFSLLGSIIGYTTLLIINRFSLMRTNNKLKRG